MTSLAARQVSVDRQLTPPFSENSALVTRKAPDGSLSEFDGSRHGMTTRTRAGSTARAWELTAREKYAPALEPDIARLNAGKTSLQPVERDRLTDLSTWCRPAVHLQCSHGQSTISLWKLGAHEVIGVDFSANMFAQALLYSGAWAYPRAALSRLIACNTRVGDDRLGFRPRVVACARPGPRSGGAALAGASHSLGQDSPGVL